MIFGCPRCSYTKECKPQMELDKILMRYSEHFKEEGCAFIYESFSMACKHFKLEKRKEEV